VSGTQRKHHGVTQLVQVMSILWAQTETQKLTPISEGSKLGRLWDMEGYKDDKSGSGKVETLRVDFLTLVTLREDLRASYRFLFL